MKRVIFSIIGFDFHEIFDKNKMQKSDILQTDINFIGERSELPFCNNFTLSTKRLDSIIY